MGGLAQALPAAGSIAGGFADGYSKGMQIHQMQQQQAFQQQQAQQQMQMMMQQHQQQQVYQQHEMANQDATLKLHQDAAADEDRPATQADLQGYGNIFSPRELDPASSPFIGKVRAKDLHQYAAARTQMATAGAAAERTTTAQEAQKFVQKRVPVEQLRMQVAQLDKELSGFDAIFMDPDARDAKKALLVQLQQQLNEAEQGIGIHAPTTPDIETHFKDFDAAIAPYVKGQKGQ